MRIYLPKDIRVRAELTNEQLVTIDYHLQQLARLESNLGQDSTEEEVKIAKRIQNTHLQAIKNEDEAYYKAIKPVDEDE